MLKRNIGEILAGEQRLFYKMKDIWWELKEAHRRFWRGYGNSMVWGMNHNLLNLIAMLLTDLRDNHTGHPLIIGEIENDEDYVELLDLMIFHIEETQRLDLLYEENWTQNDLKENEERRKYHQDEFFRLLTRYYDTLWD